MLYKLLFYLCQHVLCISVVFHFHADFSPYCCVCFCRLFAIAMRAVIYRFFRSSMCINNIRLINFKSSPCVWRNTHTEKMSSKLIRHATQHKKCHVECQNAYLANIKLYNIRFNVTQLKLQYIYGVCKYLSFMFNYFAGDDGLQNCICQNYF